MILEVAFGTLSEDLQRINTRIAHVKDFMSRLSNPGSAITKDYRMALAYLEDVQKVAAAHFAVICKEREDDQERQRKADEERMARPRGPEQAKEMAAKKAEQQGG